MKILLIEDEVEIANFLRRGLKTEGFVVTHAENGEDALRLMGQEAFEVVILDLLLPTMSGEEILRKMREEGNNVPVVVLTSVDDPEVKIKLLNAGADDYLVKPFSFVELAARLRSVLRRSNDYEKQSEELVVGDLKLLPNMRMAERGGKLIKLRFKEYMLLEYFMRNPNKVVSRTALIENVWDYNAHLLSNTVDSHVSILRKKINKGFDEKMIETVHGVGYILRTPK